MEPFSKNKNNQTIHHDNTTLITDYFDFELGDIEFNQFKKELDLTKDNIENISSIIKSFQLYLKTNLISLTYPYLQKAFIPFYKKLTDANSRIYFLLLFISKIEETETILSSFFRNLIKANHLGVGKQYNALFTENVIHSIDYLHFIDKMTKWHIHNEMIILFLWILQEYFNLSFIFSKECFTIEKNFKLTFETFAKKNVLKISSFICSKLSVPLDLSLVDYKTIFLLIMANFTCATYSIFSTKQIQKLLGVSAINCAIQKISELMQYEGQLTDFRRFSGNNKMFNILDTVDFLNKNLNLIYFMLLKLIKNYIKQKSKINEIDLINLQNEVKELTNKLELFLSGENPNSLFTEKTMNIIQEIEMQENESDWCIIQDNNP